jgi:probable F420-dependent oxidoreductase
MSSAQSPQSGAPHPDASSVETLDDLGFFLTAGRIKDPRAALAEAEHAERLGLARAWLSERYDLKDAGVLLGAVSARTVTLQVGTAVVATGSRHPLLTAGLACTMQAMSDGRFTLGLGRSSAEYLRGQSITAHGYGAYADYVDIVRRLMSGETVTYDGPLGSFEALRMADLPAAASPPIWSMILGGPKACRLAARIADGVMLQPFLTPVATAQSVAWIRDERERLGLDPAIRICVPVVTACELDETETLAITKGRMVSYVQMPSFANCYVTLNHWDPRPMSAVQNHAQFHRLSRGNADQVFHRKDLLGPGKLLPDAWMEEAAAVGSVRTCVQKLQEYRDAGADEIALYGSSPLQNASLVAAWRIHTQAVGVPA